MALRYSDGLPICLKLTQSNDNQYRHPSDPLGKVMITAIQISHSWSVNKQMLYQVLWRIPALYLKM
jgi:hypothetical protein